MERPKAPAPMMTMWEFLSILGVVVRVSLRDVESDGAFLYVPGTVPDVLAHGP